MHQICSNALLFGIDKKKKKKRDTNLAKSKRLKEKNLGHNVPICGAQIFDMLLCSIKYMTPA